MGPGIGLIGWLTGCFLMASGARPLVTMLLEAWEDSVDCSGDSNTVAVNGRVDFPKKKLAHQ
jgi:hypothetical protein